MPRRAVVVRRQPQHKRRPPHLNRGTFGSAPEPARVRLYPSAITSLYGQGQQTAVACDVYNGHVFLNDGKTILEFTNTGVVAAQIRVHAGSGVAVDGLTLNDEVINVAVGRVEYSRTFPNGTFGNPTATGGYDVYFDVSTSSLSVRCYSVTASA